MTGRIPEAKVQEVRERTDIVELVSSYLPLKRSGSNHLGLCPFHGEKTPSFNVNAVRQIFHCFGCGVGGNAFAFLMRMEGLSFPEAVRRLGERVGIEVEEETLTPAEVRRREENERLVRINEVASEFYHRILLEDPEGGAARRYLRERGYDSETARGFRLGYAPDRWDSLARHLAEKGFDPALTRERLGLIRPGKEGRGDLDLFRRRLLFPIFDLRGQVVAFGGRVLDDSLPKYINSPESPIYHKGRTLFGLYQAREAMRQSGTGIVVEGYFDQLALARAGFASAVATCGTALTEEHAGLLKRYCERLLLIFDQDSAGRKATFRAMDTLLPLGLPAAVVTFAAGEDPDSFLARHGAAAFQERLAAARPVLEVYIEAVLAGQGPGIEGQARGVEMILEKLRLLPSDIERSLYLRALAQRTGLDEALLQRKGGGRGGAPPAGRPPAGGPATPPRPSRPRPDLDVKNQEWLLIMMVADAGSRQRVASEGTENLFPSEDHRAIAERVLQLGQDQERIDEARLGDPLNESQNEVLSGILIKDEKAFAEEPEAIFEGCRKAAARHRIKRRSKELLELIAQAEKAGDSGLRERCQAELLALKRML
jgi:DNA primase